MWVNIYLDGGLIDRIYNPTLSQMNAIASDSNIDTEYQPCMEDIKNFEKVKNV